MLLNMNRMASSRLLHQSIESNICKIQKDLLKRQKYFSIVNGEKKVYENYIGGVREERSRLLTKRIEVSRSQRAISHFL
jgi:hypothetical protein